MQEEEVLSVNINKDHHIEVGESSKCSSVDRLHSIHRLFMLLCLEKGQSHSFCHARSSYKVDRNVSDTISKFRIQVFVQYPLYEAYCLVVFFEKWRSQLNLSRPLFLLSKQECQ